jgi:hypothetical protein
MVLARPPGAITFPAPSSARKKSVSLDLIAEEGIDQLLGLPGEPGDHPNPQALGKGQEAAIEAAAEQHLHPGSGEALEAPGPSLLWDAQLADAKNLAPVQLGDQELICRAEPGGHVIAMKRHGQHFPVLPDGFFAESVPDRKSSRKQGLGEMSREGFWSGGTNCFRRAAIRFSMFQDVSCLRIP